MESAEEDASIDERSCLLSPFLVLPRGSEHVGYRAGVLLSPLRLPSVSLRLLPELHLNDMIAVVPSAALYLHRCDMT